jgi:organic hydroperoxide reductase OsmC/OhrA
VSHVHSFDCRLVWVGASAGPTADYASYSRELTVDVAGKPQLRASADPAFRGDASFWNPEDMLVASLSSCHCLSYLALAARKGMPVVAYEDRAHGRMERVDGVIRFTRVLLRPKVTLGAGGDRDEARALHAAAHRECFIARSMNFPVDHESEIVALGEAGAGPLRDA